MATKTSKTSKKFVPVTVMEAQNYNFAFSDWLSANCSPEVVDAFSSIGFLEIAARTGLTVDGQKMATKARNRIYKLLAVQHV